MPSRTVLITGWVLYACASIASLFLLPVWMLRFLALDHLILVYAVIPAVSFAAVCILIAAGLLARRSPVRRAVPVLCIVAGLYLAYHAQGNLLAFLALHRPANLGSGTVGVVGVYLAVRTWQTHRRGHAHERPAV